MRRTSASSVLFSTYNLLDFASYEDDHYTAIVSVIGSLEADVLAVQEVLAPDQETAAARLRRLAGDVGMHCDVPCRGPAAVAFGGHGYHVGLMWRDGIEPLPDSLRRHGGADFWHGLVQVTLDVGGTLVRHASFHATPFGRRLRTAQNERLVAAIARPAGAAPALIGADWNSECADRVLVDGAWRLYEPSDPYADVPWFGDLIHQCDWEYDDTGVRRHRADRSAGDVLWSGGLHDAAAALGAPWQPTAGHHPSDIYGVRGIRRRIDAIRVTAEVIPALRGHEVYVSSQAEAASDHLPVTVEYLPSALPAYRD
ncbi:MAG: endonuclease/exonuclease/phosphatase family protein [Streptosporangiaceae bacterium]|nr:endonuclease/exonuclease/phosphatase family protein [Streptosporangiaceae bacterium]